MTTPQPQNQRELALPEPGRGEASCRDVREVEVVMASAETESPACIRLNPPNRRGTDPYARWCGRGGVARCPPIPIDGESASRAQSFRHDARGGLSSD